MTDSSGTGGRLSGDRPVRWAVIGTGRITESFVPDLQAAGAEVTAVWGRRREAVEAFTQRYGIGFGSTDLAEVLTRADVDIVYIATPPALHLPQALQALEAGKHVLVEKPMTVSADETATLFAAARARGLFAMEAMWMVFNPLHREVFRLIDDGLIGAPRSVRGGFGMPFPAGGTRWQADLGGSTVLDQGIYPVTLAMRTLGAVHGVHATGVVRDGVDVTAQIALDHGDGSTSQLTCSILEFADPSASVSGTTGWIEIPAMFWAGDRALLHAGSTRALFTEPDVLSRPREGFGYVPMIRAVHEALGAGLLRHPDHDEDRTLAVARVLDEIRAQIFAAGP
jgi:predicted dehydrogenase